VSTRIRLSFVLLSGLLFVPSPSPAGISAGQDSDRGTGRAATGGQPAIAIPAALRGDARLDQKATAAHKNEPLGQVLAQLGRQIQVPLSANSDTADDKVTLFMEQRPAAEILALIGQMFDFQWYQKGSGYELGQSSNSKRREATLREKALAARLAAIRARMDLLVQIASTPRDRLDARQGEIDARLAAPELGAEERARLGEEKEAIADLVLPGGAASVAIYRSLSAAQFRQVIAGGELRLTSADGSLNPALASLVHQSADDLRKSGRVIQLGAAGGPGAADQRPEQADALVRLTESAAMRFGPPRRLGSGPGPRPRLRLEFILTSRRGDQGGPVAATPTRMAFPVLWSPNVAANEASGPRPATVTDDPALKREVELTFRSPGPPGGDPGLAAGVAALILGGDRPAGLPTVSDVAEQLHRATGLEVLADCFVRARLDRGLVSGRRPVVRILDALSQELDYTWEKQGNLLRIRNSRFYEDRPAEVPERVLRPWRERVAKAGAPTLDDLAELAAALQDRQCRSMQDYWSWYLENGIPSPQGPGGFYGSRHHLRLWARLNLLQKRSALSGAIIPVEKMNPLQRQAFVIALTAPDESAFPGASVLRGAGGQQPQPPTAADVAAGGFSLRSAEMRQQTYLGAGGDGQTRAVVGVTGERAGGGPPLAGFTGPDGLKLEPSGPPRLLDSITFAYHLAGNQTPARTATISLPRPTPKPQGGSGGG
jgi:hypothetical protein